jgi:hypothetical protein
MKDIRNAMDKYARGEISKKQLLDWATLVPLNHAYHWQGPEEDDIAGWLNEISMLSLKADSDAGDPCSNRCRGGTTSHYGSRMP